MEQRILRTEIAPRPDLAPLALEFEARLGKGREEEIQRFIAANRDFFFPGTHTFSKYKLADTFVTDYAIVRPGTRHANYPGAYVVLVEIERADLQLFTKKGDPSAALTHALRQVQDWKAWVKSNREYLGHRLAQKLREDVHLGDDEDSSFQFGFREWYSVIIGRRGSLSLKDRMRLGQINDDLDGIAIITFDTLLDHILAMVQGKPSSWPRYLFF